MSTNNQHNLGEYVPLEEQNIINGRKIKNDNNVIQIVKR